MRILFLQLPLLDNDPAGPAENRPLAAACLAWTLQRAGGAWTVLPGEGHDGLDNRHLAGAVAAAAPDAIAATLYAWNIERTLRLLRAVRVRLPRAAIVVGGPEVARDHPFLFRSRVPDAAVVGEGEAVFPAVMAALRDGARADFANVAWRDGRVYRWGTRAPPAPPLAELLPPAAAATNRPDADGAASIETVRGCPARCAFCCYRRRRTGMSWLPVADVIARLRVLRRRGAREIRFIDPTFNAHPRCAELLAAIARLNADRGMRFFAEVRADTVTDRLAALLAAANVREVEVGVQSGDPAVLRAVRRPGAPARVQAGIARLAAHGIRMTLDLMCGLPEQTAADVRKTLRALARVPGGRVQLLHTLLIPGSALRRRRRALGLRAQALPPYRVTATPAMSAADMLAADAFAARRLGRRMDCPAARFVGERLPDLFAERVLVDLDRGAGGLPGRACRRALVFRHEDLFARRGALLAVVRRALREEPDMLWQFVLSPAREEPLDLLDALVGAIDAAPPHFVDRLHVAGSGPARVSRRVFIRLRRGRRYDAGWLAAAERCLAAAFY